MRTAFTESLRLTLDFLVKRSALTVEEADLLYQMLIRSENARTERDEFLLSIDKSYLTDEIGYQENYDARRETGCAELSMHPRNHAKAAQNLIKTGVLIEKTDGVAPIEPSHQVPLEILLSRTALEPIAKQLPKFTHWISQLGSLTGIIVPLPERQRVVNEVTYKLGESASILLSRSPSIFNPKEFESTYSNHTLYFADAVGRASHPLFYFWDLDAVCSQIQDHLKDNTSDVDKLQGKYIEHFSPYARNDHLIVVCSNNSAVQEDWEVRPFVSKDFLVKGEREGGKLTRGAMVNRRRLESLLSHVPYLGKWVKLTVETYFEERYERLRRQILDDPNNIILRKHDNTSISEFVTKIFNVATSRSTR